MKLLLVFSIAMLAAAEGRATKKGNDPAPPAATPVKAVEIPASAVQTGPWSYSYTDPGGKAWIYRKTPFGVMRFEDRPADPAEQDRRIGDVKATEDGETVRFERPSPFGVIRWQTKKSELNEMERAVWERELSRHSPEQE